jgi:hypothetical protein
LNFYQVLANRILFGCDIKDRWRILSYIISHIFFYLTLILAAMKLKQPSFFNRKKVQDD